MNTIVTRIGTDYESIEMRSQGGHRVRMEMEFDPRTGFAFVQKRFTPRGQEKSAKRFVDFASVVDCKRMMIIEAEALFRRGYVRVEA